ncbi:sugar phosphate isomerase/epimerase [Pseudonocardia kujensis]|nr:sugar phosphate isomerase/epimerase [Pseudonocardia kujensis]MCE0764921.1 sugar phosphate isomerase/epimerase [Pseudonocardia kujensis]
MGVRCIKIGGRLSGGTYEPDRVVAELALLAEQADRAGTTVGLEPMPFADIRTPQDALDVVIGAGHPAGGIFLDVWHVGRAGLDMATVADIPAHHIAGVELDDADAEVRGSLLEDTLHHRRFPGEGDLDVVGFVSAVAATGYGGPWGVEMLSREFRALDPGEAARRAHDTTAGALRATAA